MVERPRESGCPVSTPPYHHAFSFFFSLFFLPLASTFSRASLPNTIEQLVLRLSSFPVMMTWISLHLATQPTLVFLYISLFYDR